MIVTSPIGILPVTPQFPTSVPGSTHSREGGAKNEMPDTRPPRERALKLRQEAGKLEKHVKYAVERRAFYEEQLGHARKANNSYHISFYEQLIQKSDDRVANQVAHLQTIESRT